MKADCVLHRVGADLRVAQHETDIKIHYHVYGGVFLCYNHAREKKRFKKQHIVDDINLRLRTDERVRE